MHAKAALLLKGDLDINWLKLKKFNDFNTFCVAFQTPGDQYPANMTDSAKITVRQRLQLKCLNFKHYPLFYFIWS